MLGNPLSFLDLRQILETLPLQSFLPGLSHGCLLGNPLRVLDLRQILKTFLRQGFILSLDCLDVGRYFLRAIDSTRLWNFSIPGVVFANRIDAFTFLVYRGLLQRWYATGAFNIRTQYGNVTDADDS